MAQVIISLDELRTSCRNLQVNLFDTSPERLARLLGQIERRPLESGIALVMASEHREEPPPVALCTTPPGVAPPPNLSGRPSDPPVYSSPQEALHSFLEDRQHLLRFGYTEIHLPDRSIVYGVTAPSSPRFVTVIRVVEEADRWAVAEWEASGC
jgi:hypothetical protein